MVEMFPSRAAAYAAAARLLALLLLPVAFVRSPRRARYLACEWALALRYPAEQLDGLTPAARAAFTAARTEAFWRDGQLIGLTSGHRDAAEQHALFTTEVRRRGSAPAARRFVLPPEESAHVAGYGLDVRPSEGAAWLERHGAAYHLHRRYDNEWWHFEYHPDTVPFRLPNPGARAYAS
ncbi:MAG TPA: D-alanyl-D-alanine carboxypeptidase [Amycolatopsis sp.]|nr:D-alanyl-D-alanine carboxypeptidase [Amycolatopsis sp.]